MKVHQIVQITVDARIDDDFLIPCGAKGMIVEIDNDGYRIEFDRYQGKYYFQADEFVTL